MQDEDGISCVKRQVTRIRIRSPHRVCHCFSSMDSFETTLGPYFKSCESCEYGNKPIDLPFLGWSVSRFHLLLLLVPFALRNLFTLL